MENVIECKKEAALRVLLNRLESIDADSSTRSAFGGSIVMSQMYQMNNAIFEPEINLIREVLGIPNPIKQEVKVESVAPREFQIADL